MKLWNIVSYIFLIIFVLGIGVFFEYFFKNTSLGFITLSLNGLLVLFSTFYHQKQKNDLEKEVEKYKTELQIEVMKSEVKTTQLFKIYPEMYYKFKLAESEIFQLKGPVKKQRAITELDKNRARDVFIDANNYMLYNELFISKETVQLATAVSDLMIACLYDKYDNNMRYAVDKLKLQMKEELESKTLNNKI